MIPCLELQKYTFFSNCIIHIEKLFFQYPIQYSKPANYYICKSIFMLQNNNICESG